MPPIVSVMPSPSVTILKQKVMIACPWQKMANPITAFCVAQLADKRRTASMLNYGDAYVSHTRNHCAEYFLKTKLEWILMVDDDMLVPFGNAEFYNAYMGHETPEPFCSFNAIDRLLSHGKTLVGALYWGRFKNSWACYGESKAEVEYARKAPFNLVKPTRWLGTGCLLIHRTVFEDIEKRFPYLARTPDGAGGHWFSTSEHHLLDGLHKTRNMLSQGPMTGEKAMRAYEMLEAQLQLAKRQSSLGMGEDAQFCIRASEAGHQPHVDMGLRCGHIGYHVY